MLWMLIVRMSQKVQNYFTKCWSLKQKWFVS